MIIVTGSDGIVGRALCLALRSDSIPFLPITHRRKLHTDPAALVADLTENILSLEKYCDDITAIVHLAAAVPHSTDYPDNEISAEKTRCMDNNISSLQKLTNAQVIYMSTCGLYDRSLGVVKHEDDASAIRIESPYFSAKLKGERLFKDSQLATILRLSAPVGPGLKPSVVLCRFIMAARSGKPIQIWGSGSREQNFIDVRDVADLIMKVLLAPHPCTINVAAKVPTTMVDLGIAVVKAVGKGSFEYSGQFDPRDGETARYSISKAWELYGWSPKYELADSCRLLLNEKFDN
jgi:UDP-glucose 4-epimerase